MEEPKRRGSLVGPVILIGLGIVFLLNNLGVLSWSVWDVILGLWPVLLIAAGLDLLLGRRSVWGSLLALAILAAAVAGALWLFNTGVVPAVPAEEISQALNGATRAEVVLAPAVGRVHVESLTESGNLLEGVVRPTRGEQVSHDFTVADETAKLALRSAGVFAPALGGWDSHRGWDIELTPDVPLDLEVSFGMGECEVDLTDLTVTDLQVSIGIGQVTVVLPEAGSFQARIEGAIGKTVVVIPREMAARIQTDTALGSADLPEGYRQQGDAYVSPDYESADHRVDLEVSQAIGQVSIQHSVGE